MNLKDKVVREVEFSRKSGRFDVTIVFREVPEENVWVAECVDIPGCVSQGVTKEEAEKNMKDAINLCVSVIIEDAMACTARRQSPMDYTGISMQERMIVTVNPESEVCFAN